MVNREPVTSEIDLSQLTALFRLLSDKTRLNILMLLSGGEQNVTWLCNELSLPQPTVSHHLGLLRMSNLIGNRRNGKQVFYQLNGRVNLESAGVMGIHAEHYTVSITRSGVTASAHSTLEHPVVAR